MRFLSNMFMILPKVGVSHAPDRLLCSKSNLPLFFPISKQGADGLE